ncbi:hypothetical protein PIB30_019988 [Stylosanthes scabra]|uniref:Uncharacterized protein n=1 Tax=Stylosanthes scabra TaxID=79078 RepID=A0ABU6Z7U3_9FABA|nr:hypothetical protein [Stylosanthes scabra]
MERFNKACLEIQQLPTEAAIMGLINGLREGPLSQSILKRHPTSLPEVQERVEKYINLEEASQLRKHASGERERNNKRGGEELGKEKFKKRGEEEYSSQA